MKLFEFITERPGIALRCNGEDFSYSDLDFESSVQAATISGLLGAGPEPVTTNYGYQFDERWHISALGIMKAGKVAAQIKWTEQARAIGGRLSFSGGYFHDTDKKPEFLPYSDAAYIDFTSGSTGSAKAVVHSHDRMVQLAKDDAAFYELKPGDRVGQYRPGGSGYRLAFAAWAAGATLVCKSWQETGSLADWINEEKITVLTCNASTFRHLMVSGQKFPTVRIIEVGGEMVTGEDLELHRFHNCLFVVRYACSEVHIVSRFTFSMASIKPAPGPLPVGLDARVRIVDEDLKEMPAGKMGEILTTTPYMAIEYWKDPELTARKFLVAPHRRWYLTGDYGYKKGGLLYLAGRKDFQGEVRDKFNAEVEKEQTVTKALKETPGL